MPSRPKFPERFTRFPSRKLTPDEREARWKDLIRHYGLEQLFNAVMSKEKPASIETQGAFWQRLALVLVEDHARFLRSSPGEELARDQAHLVLLVRKNGGPTNALRKFVGGNSLPIRFRKRNFGSLMQAYKTIPKDILSDPMGVLLPYEIARLKLRNRQVTRKPSVSAGVKIPD